MGTEDHPVYQELEASNRDRQYSFLEGVVLAASDSGAPCWGHTIIKALNFHVIAGLHQEAGRYRRSNVVVAKPYAPDFIPPDASVVEAGMQRFVDWISNDWSVLGPIRLGANVLWGLNLIHPFRQRRWKGCTGCMSLGCVP